MIYSINKRHHPNMAPKARAGASSFLCYFSCFPSEDKFTEAGMERLLQRKQKGSQDPGI